MADVDALIRDALGRAAEPGDPSGVAAAIRTRLAAGGSGASPSGGAGSSGGAGGLAGLRPWLPWAGLAVALGAAGVAAGAAGMFGHPSETAPELLGHLDGGVHASACPGGSAVEELQPGQRVLVIERNSDGTWLAVRDPYALTRTVWLPSGAIVVDEGQAAIDTLDVGGCPVPSVEPSTEPEPEPTTPSPEPSPIETTPAPPAADTTRPSISAGSWNAAVLYPLGYESYCGPSSASIVITASDNVGVTNVSATTTHPGATVTMTGHSGTTYTFKFQMPADDPYPATTATVHFTARDAAGNTRSVDATIPVSYCLI